MWMSFIFFVSGLVIASAIFNRVNNYDRYHWLLIVPVIFPLIGLGFSTILLIKSMGRVRLLGIILGLANLGLAAFIFIGYALSYWQD